MDEISFFCLVFMSLRSVRSTSEQSGTYNPDFTKFSIPTFLRESQCPGKFVHGQRTNQTASNYCPYLGIVCKCSSHPITMEFYLAMRWYQYCVSHQCLSRDFQFNVLTGNTSQINITQLWGHLPVTLKIC